MLFWLVKLWVWLIWYGFVGGVVWFTIGWLVGNFSVVCFNLGLGLAEVWFLFGFGVVWSRKGLVLSFGVDFTVIRF